MKVTQPYNSCFKKYSETRGNKRSSIKKCSEQQLSSSSNHGDGNSYENDSKNDTPISCIPTLVNGEACFEKKDRNKKVESDNNSHVQLLLREATRKLIVKKKRF
jgi:hypothetical protein